MAPGNRSTNRLLDDCDPLYLHFCEAARRKRRLVVARSKVRQRSACGSTEQAETSVDFIFKLVIASVLSAVSRMRFNGHFTRMKPSLPLAVELPLLSG